MELLGHVSPVSPDTQPAVTMLGRDVAPRLRFRFTLHASEMSH